MARPSIEPVTAETLQEFAEFLHQHLDASRSVPQWLEGFRSGWCATQPNYGFVLRDGSRIVGGIGAIYADRMIGGASQRFCNITSWCVLDDYRQQSMRLAMSLIGQKGFTFTDFSPTKVVASSLLFLKFKPLDERQVVLFNLPWLGGGRVLTDREAIESALSGEAAQHYREHARFPWLCHALVGTAGKWCHVIYKRTVFKGLPAARVLYIGDAKLFSAQQRRFCAHLLVRGIVTTHVDHRVLTTPVAPHVIRSGFNPKVYLSETLHDNDIDYLYSESMAFDLI